MTQTSAEELFEQAVALQQAGRLPEAKSAYATLLTVTPNDADALQFLAMIESQLGRKEEALKLLNDVVVLSPEAADAFYSRGALLAELGRHGEAVAAFRHALFLKPGFAEAQNYLGVSLRAMGELAQAAEAFHEACALKREYAEAFNNLGIVLRAQDKVAEAIEAYRKAISIRPRIVDIHRNLAHALNGAGELDQAAAELKRIVELEPSRIQNYLELAAQQQLAGYPKDVAATLAKAIEIEPNHPDVLNNLANANLQLGRLTEAVDLYHKAIALRPDFLLPYNNLGTTQKEMGRVRDAIASYRKAMEGHPNAAFHSNLLMCLNCLSDQSPAEIFREHRHWNELHASAFADEVQRMHENNREPDRRLKIGYVSPDFREHSVAFFLKSILASHRAAAVEVFCYNDFVREDDTTREMMKSAHHWRKTASMTDQKLAETIRSDKIDILVDLAGHTAGNRLPVFARKPAPIQITYLGYPNTTGLTAMDYRITDPVADVMGQTESLHSERLLRLPNCFLCYAPPRNAPLVNDPPAAGAKRITFGSFNNLAKISDATVKLWSQVLEKVSESNLVMKSRGFDDETARNNLLNRFAEVGIGADRLELLGKDPTISRHLEQYYKIDIALDTYPYHGTATTCESLWMGIPVVTLAGATHASRVGASILTAAGLEKQIADSPQQFIGIAAGLASDLPGLQKLRATLRKRIADSSLLNGPRFVEQLEAEYRRAWQNWCKDRK